MQRLADAAETEAGVSNSGSITERATLALESLGGTSRDSSYGYAVRMALASQDINSAAPILTGSPFVNAALNLESASGLTATLATPIQRMILAIQQGFA
jgi:hypothetical protein